MNIPHKKRIGNTGAKDCKINDDIQLIQSKHRECPIDDIKPLKLEIYHTDDHIAGLQVIYVLVDQKKKHNKKRKLNEKITFEFEGHKSKGSKFFGVKSTEFKLEDQESITKIYGISTDQIDKISFQTNTGKIHNFPPNQPIDPKIKPNQQFYFEIPHNSTIVGFTTGFSRFLYFIEISYRINAPLISDIQKNYPYNNPNMIQNQYPMQQNNMGGGIIGQPNINQMNQIQNMNQFQIQQPNQNPNIPQQFQQKNMVSNFNYPMLPSQVQQQQIGNSNQFSYNYPSESQINSLNRQPNIQPDQQQQNMNNQQNFNYNQQYPQFMNNNQSNNNQNIPQSLRNEQSNFPQQQIFPPPAPPAANESILSIESNNQHNIGFQRSSTMQVQGSNPPMISQQFNQNNQNHPMNKSGNHNNHPLNIQSIPQRQQNQFAPKQQSLMRGQSFSNEYMQQYNQVLQISEQLHKIVYNDNNKIKLQIKGHIIQQSDSMILSLISSKQTSHVTYIIEFENLQNQGNIQKIQRRYKEFNALRECLIESYPGLPVPMLPNKTLGKNLDEKFIEDRKEELQIFLDELCLYNLLFKSKSAQMFLNPSVSSKDLLSELEKMKHNVEGQNKHLLYPEYTKIFQCIDSYQLKQQQIDEVEEFKKFLAQKYQIIEKLKNKAQDTKEKMVTYYGFLNNFKKNFVKDYEDQVLSGYKELDGRKVNMSLQQQQQNANQMSDQDIMVQQTHISNKAFIQQYYLILREYQILTEFLRIFSYQQTVQAQHAKLFQKLLRTKVRENHKEMQNEVGFLKWMDLFITKIFYFCLIPFHKRDQTTRYQRTVANIAEVEKSNNDNMRQYWLFVMLREQIQYNQIKQAEQLQIQQKQSKLEQLKNDQKNKQNQEQINQIQQNQQQPQIPQQQNELWQSTLGRDCNTDMGLQDPVAQQQPQQIQQQSGLYSQLSEEQKNNAQDYNNYYQMYSNQSNNENNNQQNIYSYPIKNDQEEQNQQQYQYPQIQTNEKQNDNQDFNDQNPQQNEIHNQQIDQKPSSLIKQKLIVEQNQKKEQEQNENEVFQQLFLQQLDLDDNYSQQNNQQQNNSQQLIQQQENNYQQNNYQQNNQQQNNNQYNNQQYNNQQQQQLNQNNNNDSDDDEHREAQLLCE